jgi:hypothetical protein
MSLQLLFLLELNSMTQRIHPTNTSLLSMTHFLSLNHPSSLQMNIKQERQKKEKRERGSIQRQMKRRSS